MSSFEGFTAEELTSLLVEICSEVECIVEYEDEYTTGGTSLICDVGGLEFTCFLLGEEPFWNGLSLTSSRSAPPNPLHFCNRINSGPQLSRAYQIQPLDDDDDFDAQCHHPHHVCPVADRRRKIRILKANNGQAEQDLHPHRR